jgi:hypothetical protein
LPGGRFPHAPGFPTGLLHHDVQMKVQSLSPVYNGVTCYFEMIVQ